MNVSSRLGIIIVTYQSERHIGPLLRSLAGTVDRARTSIWIFDNASTDATVSVAESENQAHNFLARLIKSETNLGFAKANNEVYARMQSETPCDTVILLNPDTVVLYTWWQPLLAALDNPEVGTVVPLLLMPDGTVNARGNGLHFLGIGFVQGFGETVLPSPQEDNHLFFGSGAALAFKTATLEAVNQRLGTSGIFWEDLFLYAEDTDLGWRMRLAGLDNRLVPVSHVTHDYRFWTQAEDDTGDRLFWIERNRYLLLLSNFKWATLVLLLPWILGSEIALSIGLWKLYPHRVRLWKAVASELEAPVFWKRRERIQAGRTARDRDILRAMTGSIQHGARPFGIMDWILDLGLRVSRGILLLVVWW